MSDGCLAQAVLVIRGRHWKAALDDLSYQLFVFGIAADASAYLAVAVRTEDGVSLFAAREQLRHGAS
jgi:hypothetical protein